MSSLNDGTFRLLAQKALDVGDVPLAFDIFALADDWRYRRLPDHKVAAEMLALSERLSKNKGGCDDARKGIAQSVRDHVVAMYAGSVSVK